MKGIATTAVLGLLLAEAVQAQPAQRPPAQAQRQPGPSAAAPALPTRVTAKMLSDLCARDRGVCLGYVTGAIDSWASALAAAGRPQVFCIPVGVNNDQVTQATVRFLRSNPQEGNLNASLVIFTALKASFPCGY